MKLASALECYVCGNQSDNTQKCLNTIKTCEPDEDVCKTEIRWGNLLGISTSVLKLNKLYSVVVGSTPYWDFGAPKQFYVSKSCATKKKCQAIRSKYMPYCTHIWYEDWSCSECCLGDRCNYYVIVSSSLNYLIVIIVISNDFNILERRIIADGVFHCLDISLHFK